MANQKLVSEGSGKNKEWHSVDDLMVIGDKLQEQEREKRIRTNFGLWLGMVGVTLLAGISLLGVDLLQKRSEGLGEVRTKAFESQKEVTGTNSPIVPAAEDDSSIWVWVHTQQAVVVVESEGLMSGVDEKGIRHNDLASVKTFSDNNAQVFFVDKPKSGEYLLKFAQIREPFSVGVEAFNRNNDFVLIEAEVEESSGSAEFQVKFDKEQEEDFVSLNRI